MQAARAVKGHWLGLASVDERSSGYTRGMLSVAATLAMLSVLNAPPEDALVGRWGPPGDKRAAIDLAPNGLGRLVISAGIWSATERELRLVDPLKPDKPYAVPYTLQKGKLTVVFDGTSVTYERLDAPPEYGGPKAPEPPRLLGHGFVRAGADVYRLAQRDGGFMAVGSSSWLLFMEGSDASFEALGPGVGKDTQGVYCVQREKSTQKPPLLEGADPKTFHSLGNVTRRSRPYYADAKNVFTRCRRLVKRERAGATTRLASFDAKTFGSASCDLLKDHSGVYAPVPSFGASQDPAQLEASPRLFRLLESAQLDVYERVGEAGDGSKELECDKLPKPAVLKAEDLPASVR